MENMTCVCKISALDPPMGARRVVADGSQLGSLRLLRYCCSLGGFPQEQQMRREAEEVLGGSRRGR